MLALDAELWDGVLIDLLGNSDLGQSAKARWADGRQEPYALHSWLSAVDDGELIGVASLVLPQVDNRDLAYLSVAVVPGARRRGVGTALLSEASTWARENGRHIHQAFAWERLVAPGPTTISAAEGDGCVDPSAPAPAFLLNSGFKLSQVETISSLTLQPQPTLDAMAGEARDGLPQRYELVQWLGDTPPEHLSAIASLMVTMSTDVPTGDAVLERELYDEDRVRAFDRQRREGGFEQLVTVARERSSGELVGFTRILHDATRPEIGDQWETLVVGAHRGHGLGWAMKTASHAALRRRWPALSRIFTGNASENSWMLDINRRLGFAPVAASGWYERREGGADQAGDR